MKKIKILQIAPYFPPHLGGLEIIAQKMSACLVKYHNVEMINITSDIGHQKGYHHYYEDGYELITIPSFDIVHHFPCFKFWSPSFRKLLKYIKQVQPDIVQTHTRFFLPTLFGGILAKVLGKKWLHVEHGSGFVTGIALWKKLFAWLYDQIFGRFVFACCDQIVSINKANVAFISKFIRKKKIQVIHNGICVPAHPHRPPSLVVQMMYIGRLSPLKGISILVQACHQLLQKGIKNRKLSIVGDGEMQELLLRDIKKYGLSSYISLLGKKSHDDIMYVLLPNTDIVINPSYQEGLPTSVLEGLASRCVVVATDVGGTKEISDKDDLLLCSPGNAHVLAENISYAISHISSLAGLSLNHIQQHFSRSTNSERYFTLYKDILGKEF